MNKEQERSEKYGCDGCCYTANSMCPIVEICPETRLKEFWATIAATLIILSFPIAVVTLIVFAILNCI